MFFMKQMTVNGKDCSLQIWDTAGQERFKSITPMFFKDAQGVLLVCDVTDKASLFGLRDWLKLIKDHAPEKIGTIMQ